MARYNSSIPELKNSTTRLYSTLSAEGRLRYCVISCCEFYNLGCSVVRFPLKNHAACELSRMRLWRVARVHFDLTADDRRSVKVV